MLSTKTEYVKSCTYLSYKIVELFYSVSNRLLFNLFNNCHSVSESFTSFEHIFD